MLLLLLLSVNFDGQLGMNDFRLGPKILKCIGWASWSVAGPTEPVTSVSSSKELAKVYEWSCITVHIFASLPCEFTRVCPSKWEDLPCSTSRIFWGAFHVSRVQACEQSFIQRPSCLLLCLSKTLPTQASLVSENYTKSFPYIGPPSVK